MAAGAGAVMEPAISIEYEPSEAMEMSDAIGDDTISRRISVRRAQRTRRVAQVRMGKKNSRAEHQV